jgi:hypothetical protein
MLEAANARPRFTISLKRSTQNLQLSTSRRPITPSLLSLATKRRTSHKVADVPIATIRPRVMANDPLLQLRQSAP